MKTRIINFMFMMAGFIIAIMNLSSCSEEQMVESSIVNGAPQTIDVYLSRSDTKISLDYADDLLSARWQLGDSLSVVPFAAYDEDAGFYKAADISSTPAVFELVSAPKSTKTHYGIYYPASIRCDIDFIEFSYTGQVQKKSDPLAHLDKYFCLRKIQESYDTVDYTVGAEKSACMVFKLSGMTFKNPRQITLSIAGSSVSFYETNRVVNGVYYVKNSGDKAVYQTNAELSLGLEGYGEEDTLTAYMMMSNVDITIPADTKVSVTVSCEDGDFISYITTPEEITLNGGYCHELTIDDSWNNSEPDFTEYEYDGEVVTLNEGVDGLDIVLMGDGFIAEDFDNDTYDRIMRESYENLFSVEPYKSFRDKFHVCYVKVVSPQRTLASNTGLNGAMNGNTITALSTVFTPNSTSINGDKDAVLKYASKAVDEEYMKNVTIVVIANQACHSGTCWNYRTKDSKYDYGEAYSISYFGLGRTREQGLSVMRHEVLGHGFGKLDDEYGVNNKELANPVADWGDYKTVYHPVGFYRNVDTYVEYADVNKYGSTFLSKYGLSLLATNKNTVLWHDLFGTDNKYESEDVESMGIYIGGNSYPNAFCRPTEKAENSIMNHDTGIFNAPSRRQIIYRIRSLMGITEGNFDSSAELNYFLQWDKENFLPKLKTEMNKSVQQRRAGRYVLQDETYHEKDHVVIEE